MAQRVYASKNPYTHELLETYEFTSPEELENTINASQLAFQSFSKLSFQARAEKIRLLGSLIRERKNHLARLMTIEMGKPITHSISEILKCAECCDYYAENAEKLLHPITYDLPDGRSYVRFEPVGPLLVIMPFNFPYWTPFKAVVPHLMSGNTIILKHDENMPQVSAAIDQITTDAGLEHEFKSVRLTIEQIGQVIADKRVQGVHITGSVRAGRSVAEIAGRNLKKCVLELGGSDPFIVLRDCNIKNAAKSAVIRRLNACGQVCIAPKRFIIEEPVYDEFYHELIQELENWKFGDPLNEATKLGPLAREDILTNIAGQVERSVNMGAQVVYGGRVLSSTQLEPTVMINITQDMPVMKEETFGPVFPLYKVGSVEEAIEVANNTEYGLGATIYTVDVQRAEEEIIPKIQAGMIFINDVTKSLVPVPFGGIKNSGLGRELGEIGIREFTVMKTVFVKS
ncbi:unnamed protein product [Blepharisma stoltei]|uniref:Aldehyde dehydrogenase domain-containing protein n=1 Tax=Blepharisma stoltei TaxID=1481888 RepID=A0AAU9ITI1_9CILI|nr:unnamed protein product [Blepharisma stoltei]